MAEQIGKIASVKMGFVGYQDCEFGLQLTLSGRSWGTVTCINGGWFKEPDEHCKWTTEDQARHFGEACYKIIDTLKKLRSRMSTS